MTGGNCRDNNNDENPKNSDCQVNCKDR